MRTGQQGDDLPIRVAISGGKGSETWTACCPLAQDAQNGPAKENELREPGCATDGNNCDECRGAEWLVKRWPFFCTSPKAVRGRSTPTKLPTTNLTH